jgi:type III secretion protein J
VLQLRSLLLVFFIAVFTAGCDEQILHDLSEQDANKVLSRLSAGALDARKVLQSDGRWAISVSRDLIVPALSFLDNNRVLSPRSSPSSGNSKGGFVPSREEQWFRYERSIAASIEDSLSAMLGVLEARVHLNMPETDPLFGSRKENTGSGSVLLVVDARYAAKDEEISGLVSGAAGIPANKVTVLKSQAQIDKAGIQSIERAEAAIKILPKVAHDQRAESTAPFEIGIVLAAVVACASIGFFITRLRRRKVTFSLPTGIDSEE